MLVMWMEYSGEDFLGGRQEALPFYVEKRRLGGSGFCLIEHFGAPTI